MNKSDKEHLTLNGHSHVVRCITELKDGRIASGSNDKTIKIWDLNKSDKEHLTLNGHSNAVTCITPLKDGRIASVSDDSTIKIWE